MSMGKGEDSIDAVSQVIVTTKEPVIVELGPGAGYSLREIFSSLQPSRVYAIEISDAFRKTLTDNEEFAASIESGVLSVHGDDAESLGFIPSNSVDLIFGFNVIYFLDPLDVYLKEMKRILKPGGTFNFGVKDIAQTFDKEIYVNTDWSACLEQMKSAGFVEVKQLEKRLEGPLEYSTLVGVKPN
eukprot:CAMPEP_0197242000 /NCGR_PEP_ID=MMETSP1429-20130617/7865_1 /TAXON_ID=49237 /ORGANISM="Chaetoceros  sp., Strain UNC1202" /LENGTH=184 /DNA_ID=CAMNT_0042701925 /DNA_START=9 /DNA_END=563 /DNA_ORIENTATION=+